MIEGRPFLYQAWDGTVYHCNENGVQVIRSWSSKEEIVAFVDGDGDGYAPNPMLCGRGVQLIVAPSPKATTGKWTRQGVLMKLIVTEPWSPQELFLAGFVLRLLLSALN